MIYIQVQNLVEFTKFGHQPVYSIEWHLGEDNSELRDTEFNIFRVLSVQADEDELWVIRRELTGIPNQNFNEYSDVQRWFGDDAKFIVANFIIPRIFKAYFNNLNVPYKT